MGKIKSELFFHRVVLPIRLNKVIGLIGKFMS